MEYNFQEIEKRWKKYWKDNQTYKVNNDPSKPKCYVLDMFPYPSGAGLHVGHPLGYIASDIYARYKKMRGFNVLHPMGFDAFGLPAEQYALETGKHPATTTSENIARYKEQLDNIGFCYDWEREVRTSDPAYYKWTQWIFLQLFHSWYDRAAQKANPISELINHFETSGNKAILCPENEALKFDENEWNAFSENEKRNVLMQYRLAFQGYAEVWWCEGLGTVLANDEVVNGVSERGGFPVERKRMRQWFLRITEYADRLLSSLENLDWSDAMKEMQRNWIGKSIGAELEFKIDNAQQQNKATIKVFTTRPDTIFGVDFMVLAPEHPLVDSITTEAQQNEITAYKDYVKSRSERERMAEVKQITGVFTGGYAIHPFSNKKIPVWISEYVLAGYGTGAIMAVPSGDARDHAFARHFNIPITNIFGALYTGELAYSAKEGVLSESDFLNGLSIAEAIPKAIEKMETAGIGNAKVNYKLRDAGFSRQRYWGEPFPIVYVNGTPYAIDELSENTPHQQHDNSDLLPVELPMVESYKPGPEGQGPLANVEDWVNVKLAGKADDHLTPNPSPRAEREVAPSQKLFEEKKPIPKYSIQDAKAFEFARQNRKVNTDAEDILWQMLRNENLGVKFRREHPIEDFIADFVCLEKALIIEVDGGYHSEDAQQKWDEERTEILNQIGFEVLRFTNEQVLKEREKVLDTIKLKLKEKSFPDAQNVGEVPPLHFWRGAGGEVTFGENIGGEGDVINATRETSTMPGYAGSSWYFLRYMDPHNENAFAGRAATDYWREVDVYIGGTEHAVGHLLYSRFWTKALYDLGFIGFEEPFKKLINQGMIQGSSRIVHRISNLQFYKDGEDVLRYQEPTNLYFISSDYFDKSKEVREKLIVEICKEIGIEIPEHTDSYVGAMRLRIDVSLVDGLLLNREKFQEHYKAWGDLKLIPYDENFHTESEVEKMSKSKYNVVNPDDIVTQYGADTFRMYEMFLGPIDVSKPWDTKGIEGVHRFLKKLWRLFYDEANGSILTHDAPNENELRILHKTIKKIGDDIEKFSLNTAVSQFMICVNELTAANCHKRAILEKLTVLLAPFAPHVSEELWQVALGNTGSVTEAPFPDFEMKHVQESSKLYPVAVNGKTRLEMEFPMDAGQAEIEQTILADATIQKWLEGKAPKKIIFVKGRMINVVV